MIVDALKDVMGKSTSFLAACVGPQEDDMPAMDSSAACGTKPVSMNPDEGEVNGVDRSVGRDDASTSVPLLPLTRDCGSNMDDPPKRNERMSTAEFIALILPMIRI